MSLPQPFFAFRRPSNRSVLAFRASLGLGLVLSLAALSPMPALADLAVPAAIKTDGIPALPDALQQASGRYGDTHPAFLLDWQADNGAALITTRSDDVPQLHLIAGPGLALQKLTDGKEPVRSASFAPGRKDLIVFARDEGGNENFQFYRLSLGDKATTLLTDGTSRNTGLRWSQDGKYIAYASTKRTGHDTDIWVMDPLKPETARLVMENVGGGWEVMDWSPNGKSLLVKEELSAKISHLYLVDVATGTRKEVTPRDSDAAYGLAKFTLDGKKAYITTDHDGEFLTLYRLDLVTGTKLPFGPEIKADVEEITLSKQGHRLAIVTNEDGASVLRILDSDNGMVVSRPDTGLGVIRDLHFTSNGRKLGYVFDNAARPADLYVTPIAEPKPVRWTDSLQGNNPLATPPKVELVKLKSFDGTQISGFLYRPDEKKFPGKRPVLINIHGGPEGQSLPTWLGRNNYYVDQLGIAIFYPNVRGSSGYGKTFLDLDTGYQREDSVKDIGAVLDHLAQDKTLDAKRFGVIGGSYGGYMVLASLEHFADRLRCGVDIVGISNFVTFLNNTQEYRRDLRRVKYGDERDPKMKEFLESISPTNHVDQIKAPLLVAMGGNDPRVPASEGEQMVKALRSKGGTAWYMVAQNEGHGYGKKTNADYLFYSTAQFLQTYLLN